MISDITHSNFSKVYNNDENYLSNDILSQCKEYFDADLLNATTSEKIQWYKNLFWITSNIDLGLSHTLQHNQTGRDFLHLCDNAELKQRVHNSKWETTIGCDVGYKDCNKVTLRKTDAGYKLNGIAHWISNLNVADYASIVTIDESGHNRKVIVDLHTTKHTIDSSWELSTGMRMAQPSSLVLDNAFITDDCYIGGHDYPDTTHNATTLALVGFATNMTANVVAMYKQILSHARKTSRDRDMLMIDLELDVFNTLKQWLSRLQQFHTVDSLSSSEMYWYDHVQLYLFAKKTLIKAINVSRTFGVHEHLLKDGPSSRVFRNAITFSSHMYKFQDYRNWWGDNAHDEFDIDLYLEHSFNALIYNTPIPETW